MSKIRVVIETDGTATLSGIDYNDLNGIFTQSCLHNYDSVQEAKKDYETVKHGENLGHEHMSKGLREELHEIRMRNAESDVTYCEYMLGLAHLLGELIKQAITSEHRSSESEEDQIFIKQTETGEKVAYMVPKNTYPLPPRCYAELVSYGALGCYFTLNEAKEAHPDLDLGTNLKVACRTFGNWERI